MKKISIYGAAAALLATICPMAEATQIVSNPSNIPSYATQSLYNGGADISGGSSELAAADLFTLPSTATVTGADFDVYDSILSGTPGTVDSVTWSITTMPFSSTVLDSGTSTVTEKADLGPYANPGNLTGSYEFYADSFAITPIVLTPGTNYYLNLTNAVSSNGSDVYWADIAPNGTGRTFDVYSPPTGYTGGFEAFDITGNPAPAPESTPLMSLAAGLLILLARAIGRRSNRVASRV